MHIIILIKYVLCVPNLSREITEKLKLELFQIL